MARFFVLLAAFALVLALSVSAGRVARFDRLSAVSEGDISLMASIESNGRLSDSRVVFLLPETGYRISKSVDFSAARATVKAVMPGEASLVRLVFSSDQGRRIRHIPVR